MLDAEDAMKQDISKRTVCLNNFNKTRERDPSETITVTIAEEAVMGIQGIRDEVK